MASQLARLCTQYRRPLFGSENAKQGLYKLNYNEVEHPQSINTQLLKVSGVKSVYTYQNHSLRFSMSMVNLLIAEVLRKGKELARTMQELTYDCVPKGG